MTKSAHDKTSKGSPTARSGTARKSDPFDGPWPFQMQPTVQATEDDSDAAWAAFQSLQAEDDVRWSKTVPGALLDLIRNPRQGAEGDAIVWTDDLVTGFKGMDEDHKIWIALANEVLTASEPHVPRAELRTAIDKLALYSNDHFLRENLAMMRSQYPLSPAHMAAHANMMEKIIEFRRKLYANVYLDLKELQSFILTWLPNHIIHIDKGLAQYLSSQP